MNTEREEKKQRKMERKARDYANVVFVIIIFSGLLLMGMVHSSQQMGQVINHFKIPKR